MLNQHKTWELRGRISVESWWTWEIPFLEIKDFPGNRERGRLNHQYIHLGSLDGMGSPPGAPSWAFRSQQNLNQ
jgi:hypothetical protein